MPDPGQTKAFRFSTGFDANTKQEAASGFIQDAMDPRFGKFDPDWKGDWTVEIRASPETEQREALISIPFSSLGTKPPEPGAFWRANLAMIRAKNVSTWSTASGVRHPGDPSGFGEWVFISTLPNQN